MADFKVLVDGDEVLKIITDAKTGYSKLSRVVVVDLLKDRILNLPAYPYEEREKGKWCGSVCSVCGGSTSFWYDCNFCPRCGAEMDK